MSVFRSNEGQYRPEQNSGYKHFSRSVFSGLLLDGGGGTTSLKSDTHPTKVNLGTVIPYLKKIQKTYESRDTRLEFC